MNLSALRCTPLCLIASDTRIILRPYYFGASHQLGRHVQFAAESARSWLVFLPFCRVLILPGPDGSREDGAGHRGGICLQAGVASAGGGAILPQVPLDRGAGEVDPGAAARRHQFGGEQEPHRVGHPTQICTHNRNSFLYFQRSFTFQTVWAPSLQKTYLLI